jgi:hypothetical protein
MAATSASLRRIRPSACHDDDASRRRGNLRPGGVGVCYVGGDVALEVYADRRETSTRLARARRRLQKHRKRHAPPEVSDESWSSRAWAYTARARRVEDSCAAAPIRRLCYWRPVDQGHCARLRCVRQRSRGGTPSTRTEGASSTAAQGLGRVRVCTTSRIARFAEPPSIQPLRDGPRAVLRTDRTDAARRRHRPEVGRGHAMSRDRQLHKCAFGLRHRRTAPA